MYRAGMSRAVVCLLVGGIAVPLPDRMLGMYVLVADDTYPGHTSTDDWEPALHPYQQDGANALFLTFLNPSTMPALPPAFKSLAASRGSGAEGSVPENTTLIFSVGGEAYSEQPNPWPFLKSADAARAMAAEVAKWPCDGIDLDIESGAGDAASAGQNMLEFVKALKAARPDFIVTQPVYGNPGVAAENYIVRNHAADRIGIMVYSGLESLQYVDNWDADGRNLVVAGIGGASESSVAEMASQVVKQGLGGMMVWFASVLDKSTGKAAIVYDGDGDSSSRQSAEWAKARRAMELAPPTPPPPPSPCHALTPAVTDKWCDENCLGAVKNCPPSLCKCDTITVV